MADEEPEGNETEAGPEAGAPAPKPSPPDQSGERPGPGEDAVGWFGVLLTGVYILTLIVVLLWGLVWIVPDLTSEENRPVTPPAQTTTEPAPAAASESAPGPVHAEGMLLLAVAMAGGLGGLIHAARSFYWYVGSRELRRSWLLMYYLRPLIGAALAAVFYLVIRGGFIPADQSGNVLAFVAVAGLVGLFSEEAVLKLKEVAETIFKKVPKGEDAEPQEPEADDPGANGGERS